LRLSWAVTISYLLKPKLLVKVFYSLELYANLLISY
jgi:hypothetical protein